MILCSQTFPGILALFLFHPEFFEMNLHPRMERDLDEMALYYCSKRMEK